MIRLKDSAAVLISIGLVVIFTVSAVVFFPQQTVTVISKFIFCSVKSYLPVKTLVSMQYATEVVAENLTSDHTEKIIPVEISVMSDKLTKNGLRYSKAYE